MWFCLTITVGLLALSSSTLSSGPIQASTLRLRHVFHRSATDGEEGREGGGVFLRADIPRVLKNDHQMLFNTDFLRRKAIPNIPPPLGPYLVQHKEGSFPTRPVNHEDNGDGGSSAGALRFQQQVIVVKLQRSP